MTQLSLSFLKTLFAQDSHDTASPSLVTTASRLILGGILMLACLFAFAPLHPRLPAASLDPSWMLAMNQAVAQGSVFGRDIVFTFGPYSALYTQAYHPATYPWTLVLGLLLGFSYAAMLLMHLRKQSNGWLWLYAGFLFLVDSRDALFFSYPLLVALTAYKTTLQDIDPSHLAFSKRTRIDYAFAIALLGVLPIIKGSFLPLSVVAALAGFVLYWQKGERAFASLFIVLPLLTMIVLWDMAGQPITALPDYFHSMSPIISGFAEAMSTRGSFWEIAAYILVVVLIMGSILRDYSNAILHKIAITSCVGLFLFIAFKAGFVRHDGHALAAGSALVLAALVLNIFGIARIGLLIVIFSITVFAWLHWAYVGASLNGTIIPSIRGEIWGDLMGGRLQAAFTHRLNNIRVTSPIPRLEGTTDIYPYDQAALIASGNNWVSRPVPQSYSAYTPFLARINEAHLRGPQAPDNIVFRVATIDNRFPTLDDGLSWPTLISHYAISTTDQHYAYLKKRQVPSELRKTVVMQCSYRLGKQVDLPQGEHILFAEIDVAPSLLGRIAQIVFKPTPLYISVKLADGQNNTYRFIPGMARAGFVISPLINTTEDFVRLAKGQLQLLDKNKVKSIRIGPAGSESIFWKRDYSVNLSALDTNPASISQQQDMSNTMPSHLPN